MKTLSTIIVLTLTLGFVASTTAAERYPWLDDLDKGRILARTLNKPMCIVFRCEP